MTNLPFEYGAVSYPASAAGDRANMYIVGGRRYEGNCQMEISGSQIQGDRGGFALPFVDIIAKVLSQ